MQNDKSTIFPRLRLCHTKGFSKLLSTCYHLKRVPAKPNTCSHEGKRCKVKAKKLFWKLRAQLYRNAARGTVVLPSRSLSHIWKYEQGEIVTPLDSVSQAFPLLTLSDVLPNCQEELQVVLQEFFPVR